MNRIKIGSRVKVKSWGRMLDEFDMDSDGDLSVTPYGDYFPRFFIGICNKDCYVADVLDHEPDGSTYFILDPVGDVDFDVSKLYNFAFPESILETVYDSSESLSCSESTDESFLSIINS